MWRYAGPMKTAREMLNVKPAGIVSVAPESTVLEALRLMAEKQIGALLVMDGPRLAGVLSERDYARKVALNGRSAKDTLVKEIMTEKVICIGPERSAEECMGLMSEKHIRHLPVLENDVLLGILSIRDLMDEVISQQRFKIEQLELYINRT